VSSSRKARLHGARVLVAEDGVGTGLIVLGLTIIVFPDLLPIVSGAPDSVPSMGGGMSGK
jgi:hypothetical protein